MTPTKNDPTVFFRTECEFCGHEFTTDNEDEDLCATCAMNDQLQREMDRDLG